MKRLILIFALAGCATTVQLSPEEQRCWESCLDKYGKKVDHSQWNPNTYHCRCGFKNVPVEQYDE